MSWAGCAPIDCGVVDIAPKEMMFWLYCPISIPGESRYLLPENLGPFAEIVSEVKAKFPDSFRRNYVYLTAKTLWVSGDYIGNRPGWHIDGYGTEDLNYIWADRAPTEFLIGAWDLSDDCNLSMAQMEAISREPKTYKAQKQTYPDKTLLLLDSSVIHRSPAKFEPGMRTFVKVSLSPDRYDLKGNSINHRLPETHWPLVDRQVIRNHPATRNADHG